MDAFLPYSLPIQGLKTGIHQFDYQLNAEFFGHFEDTPITECLIDAKLYFDRRPSMLVLDFEIQGSAKAVCDLCLADIFVPLKGSHRLYVKFNQEAAEDNIDDDDVVFISPKASDFNVAPYLYEFSVLSLPFVNRMDCEAEENPPCNFDALDKLNEEAEESKTDQPKPSVWDALRDLDLDN